MEKDIELICRFKSGDDTAIEELIEIYQDRLFSFFRKLGASQADAEDILQETFVKLVMKISSYEPNGKFSSYIYKIAKNNWLDFVRKKQRDKGIVIEKDGVNSLENMANVNESPVEILEKKELNEIIMTEINKLPENMRMAIVLTEIEGMKYRELSEILEVPIGTIKSRIHNGYEKLREALTPILKRGI